MLPLFAHWLLPGMADATMLSPELQKFLLIAVDAGALALAGYLALRVRGARRAAPQPEFALTEQATLAPQPTVLMLDPDAQSGHIDAPTVVVDTRQWLQESEAPVHWSLAVLYAMEWKRFEDLCPVYYREKGVPCEVMSLGVGAGFDLKLVPQGEARPTAIVHCRGWGARVLGVDVPRDLAARMAVAKVGKGFVMSSGGFTDEARHFAASHRINLIDLPMFLAMMQRLPAEAQQRLLDFATAGDWTTPSCPACGGKMLPRHKGAGKFWACPNFPRCRITCGRRAA